MGSCASAEEDKTENNNNNNKNTKNNNKKTDNTNNEVKEAAAQHREQLDKVARNWKQDTDAIWKRRYDVLAIHTDIPRLGHKIQVIDNCGGPPLPTQLLEIQNDGEVSEKGDVVYQLFLRLSYFLEGELKAQKIASSYTRYIKKTGDMSQQMLSFLGEIIDDQSITMKILKVCHQKILLPGYYTLKSQIHPDLPFRDARGSWRIIITINPDEITVVHRKRQQSTSANTEGAPDFEFEWVLTITFDKELNSMQDCSVRVCDITIRNDIDEIKKAKILDGFKTVNVSSSESEGTSSTNQIELSIQPITTEIINTE
eukprot:TRINITY_DN826_c1_g1_i1.p1 TRINITY_DN826_c1_g1~~TRINITY_DN826_c1_g1_i1.p1  ORF type:complete len:313 (-),score=59.18 TRINITY_DN826_c1_g1_i1:419-1357(-)